MVSLGKSSGKIIGQKCKTDLLEMVLIKAPKSVFQLQFNLQ